MIQIDHMPIILGAAKDATKGQWGVHSVFLWGADTERESNRSKSSCVTDFFYFQLPVKFNAHFKICRKAVQISLL